MNDRFHGPGTTIGRRDATATPEDLFARRVAVRLTEHVEATTPHDVAERLRFARTRALDRARAVAAAPQAESARPLTAPTRERGIALAGGNGRAPSPREPSAWWIRLATLLPLAALVGGLVLIQQHHVEEQIAAAAEIDAELLTDAVPPSAYGDPGFVEFLKAPRD